MNRYFLFFLIFCFIGIPACDLLAATQTINTVPSSNATFIADNSTFDEQEDADRDFLRGGNSVVNGGLSPTSANLTATITAIVAFPNGFYVQQDATSHTYTASKRTFVYVRDSDTRTITIGGAAITYDSHLVFAETTAATEIPDVPTGTLPLFYADTGAVAITSVTDLRGGFVDASYFTDLETAIDNVGANQAIVISDVQNIGTKTATQDIWIIPGGRLIVEDNLTFTTSGDLYVQYGSSTSPPIDGTSTGGNTDTLAVNGGFIADSSQRIFGINLTVSYGYGRTVYPEHWGIDGTADEVQINQAIASLPLSSILGSAGDGGDVQLASTRYYIADSILMETSVRLLGAGAPAVYTGTGGTEIIWDSTTTTGAMVKNTSGYANYTHIRNIMFTGWKDATHYCDKIIDHTNFESSEIAYCSLVGKLVGGDADKDNWPVVTYGIYGEAQLSNSIHHNNFDSLDYGIYITNTDQTVIENNVFVRISSGSIYAGTGSSFGIRILNNDFGNSLGATGTHIKLDTVVGGIIAHNRGELIGASGAATWSMTGINQYMLELYKSTEVKVSDNDFYSNSSTNIYEDWSDAAGDRTVYNFNTGGGDAAYNLSFKDGWFPDPHALPFVWYEDNIAANKSLTSISPAPGTTWNGSRIYMTRKGSVVGLLIHLGSGNPVTAGSYNVQVHRNGSELTPFTTTIDSTSGSAYVSVKVRNTQHVFDIGDYLEIKTSSLATLAPTTIDILVTLDVIYHPYED